MHGLIDTPLNLMTQKYNFICLLLPDILLKRNPKSLEKLKAHHFFEEVVSSDSKDLKASRPCFSKFDSLYALGSFRIFILKIVFAVYILLNFAVNQKLL